MARPQLTAPRLFLLLLVIIGFGGMHTLGHPGEDHGTVPDVAQSTGHLIHLMGGHGSSMAVTAGDLRSPPVHPGGGLDPSAVCLAVLTAVGLTLLMGAALRGVELPVGRGRAGLTILGRAPPPSRRGLVLAGLSVQRI